MSSVTRLRRLPNRLWSKTAPLRRTVLQRIEAGVIHRSSSGRSTAVFLVGCGRSGTNMISRRISRSWQVAFYNEGNPEAFDDYRLRDFSVIAGLRDRSQARITLFKPILDTHLSNELLARFAPAKVLFVFRHYHDVINSALKRFGPENWPDRVRAWVEQDFAEFASAPPPEVTKELIRSHWKPSLSPESAIALYWLFYNRLYFDLGLDRSPFSHLTQYEAMVTNPEPEFLSICKFLGIRYDPEMIKGINTASVRKDRQPELEVDILACCEETLADLQQRRQNANATVQQPRAA